jgi:hypothetical protein
VNRCDVCRHPLPDPRQLPSWGELRTCSQVLAAANMALKVGRLQLDALEGLREQVRKCLLHKEA